MIRGLEAVREFKTGTCYMDLDFKGKVSDFPNWALFLDIFGSFLLGTINDPNRFSIALQG